MTTELDYQIMAAVESTYGTKATPTRTVEYIEEDLDYVPEYVQGAGLRVGKRMDLSSRRALGKSSIAGSITTEALTKGLGWFFLAALGNGSSAQIGGTAAYQQLFKPTTTDYLNSWTIQKALPPLGGGAAIPKTFLGMVCSGFEFSANGAGIPTIKFNWLGKDVDTASSAGTAAYPTGVKELAFINAQLVVGQTVTPPTATALGTSTGNRGLVNVRDIDLTWDNGLDAEGFNFNGAGKRSRPNALGKRTLTGSFTAEFTDSGLESDYLLQADSGLLLTYALSSASDLIAGTSYPALQLCVPLIRLEGELAKSNGGDVITQAIGFTGLDGQVAADPFSVAIVTAETAI